jgi:hypothetical protein
MLLLLVGGPMESPRVDRLILIMQLATIGNKIIGLATEYLCILLLSQGQQYGWGSPDKLSFYSIRISYKD